MKTTKRYLVLFLVILVGMLFYNTNESNAATKKITPKRIKSIYQDVVYTYKDAKGNSVTKTVKEPVACSLYGCEEHSKDHITEGLKLNQKIDEIVQCESGSDLYNIKVPVKTIKNKKITIEYQTLRNLDFYSIQGSCFHDNDLYIAFSDKEKTKSAKEIQNITKVKIVNLTAVVKLTFKNKKYEVAQVEFIKGMEQIDDAINYMGHANDMTFSDGKLQTAWYEVTKNEKGKDGKKKKKTIKKFTLGYIDISGQTKGMAVNIGDSKDSKYKSVFGIATYGKKNELAVGIRDTSSKSTKRYVELYKYKRRKNSKFKYQYVRKKRLFDIKKEKYNKYPITQCMASNGKYIYINKYTEEKKVNNNCIQIYKNKKYIETKIVKDPSVKTHDGATKSLKSRKWEMEGFGKIKGKNQFYCVMVMPSTSDTLLKGKQAYLCILKIKPKK